MTFAQAPVGTQYLGTGISFGHVMEKTGPQSSRVIGHSSFGVFGPLCDDGHDDVYVGTDTWELYPSESVRYGKGAGK